ncbi:alpha-glucan water dikinase 2 isoform X2 [Euphorbia lathyris]|uniref:alpha-glucan water dikinase 2 isoform X2 n=1 Tax=Euphorbia lathyris TaxID=212925 RepID=UPI0033137A10
MASSKTRPIQHFQLVDGMQLQMIVSGSLNGNNVRIELQLKNCTRVWVLHWGCIFQGNPNWFIPTDSSSGTKSYRQGALQTPFTKSGELYIVKIELRDPILRAIEFVLKDGSSNRWMKLNNGNFRIDLPEHDENILHSSISNDLIQRKAYLIWESKGRPISSPEQKKQDYDDAVRELQSQLKKVSLNQSQSSCCKSATSKPLSDNRVHPGFVSSAYCRRHNVDQWLHKDSGHGKRMNMPVSALIDLVERTIGGDKAVRKQSHKVGKYEIVVLTKITKNDHHILVAINTKGSTVLHWGMSKSSPGEWSAPPSDILPERSQLLVGACQTCFVEVSTGQGSFQYVDINLQQRNFLGMQFVIYAGGSWIKVNGENFFVLLKSNASGKVDEDDKEIVKWLLDEIYQREKEAERSLMHRYNIATELSERCKIDGELGLIGILVWLRFMACRHLTWNKNYNVKPREISEAQDKFTNLLQKIYSNQPNEREIVRLIMLCIGRGGQGDLGQKIRDEILLIQRNNNCKTDMMEEWHQKLHNNSSPDDVIICEALLNYVRCGFKSDVYWQTLNAKGLTKEKLASYDRPIVSEPRFSPDAKEGLILDLTMYLKTLKAVHSGADLESAIENCLGLSSKEDNLYLGNSTPKLRDHLNFVRAHVSDMNIGSLMEKLVESRIELRPMLLTCLGKAKDLLFLDLALDSAARTTMERGLKGLSFDQPLDAMLFISLVLENLCLSTVNNEGLIYCTKDCYRVCESYVPNDVQWALQAKAILDRLQLILADRSHEYQQKIQPSVNYLGNLLGIEKWVINIFTEELIRSGSGAILSSLINHFDPVLRKIANLGCWQVISPMEACGFVTSVHELITIQNKVYRKPTVVIANRVTGEEEIPDGVVAVLTPDMPDILSHISIRARNSKVCFATCFDQNVLRNLKLKEGKVVSIRLKSMNLIISDISGTNQSLNSSGFTSISRTVNLKRKTFCGKYAISVEEFTAEMVGAKSCNVKFLRERVPSCIKIPLSVALPFGTFEAVLSEDINKGVANRISSHHKSVMGGDLTKLRAIQDDIQQMSAPSTLRYELKSKIRSSRIPWPGDESEERWNHAWQAIKKVWASKWNERAYASCRKSNLNHDNLSMGVLIQEVIGGEYAFVIHTKNPISGDASEIYAEIVKGLGETLVGAYPGRAMSFITKKGNSKFPIVTSYPSKNIGLYSRQSVIFRSDSNGEDLEGHAGAGLYDSVLMDKEEKIVVDYSNDRMVVDKAFQIWLFGKLADVGKIVEGIYGCPQDIEGVVKDGVIYVVQARPQI